MKKPCLKARLLMRPCMAALVVCACLTGFSQTVGLKYIGAGHAGSLGPASRVSWDGSQLTVAAGADGLQVFDVGNPSQPVYQGAMRTSRWSSLYASDVFRVGNLAFVAAARDGLEIVDLTNPATPVMAGSYGAGGSSRAVVVVGQYAYLAAQDGGVYVIDISNPAYPSQAGHFPSSLADTLMANDICVAGPYAYVAGAADGLVILRVDYPDMISRLGNLSLGANAIEVALTGNTACVLTDDGRLNLVDVTSPRNPVLLGRYPQSAGQLDASGLTIDGTLVYLAAGSNGVQVIDIKNPAQPVLVGQTVTYGPARGVCLINGMAAVACGSSGFVILQPVPNPTSLPAVSSGPADQNAAKGTTVQFSVAATGAPLSYQWLFNGLPIPNATNAVLTLTNVVRTNAGVYTVVVSTDSGSVLSRNANLGVVYPPVIVAQPEDRRAVESNSISLWSAADTADPVAYQWFLNGKALPGETHQYLTLNSLRLDQAGAYSVMFSNLAAVVWSTNATVTVLPLVTVQSVAKWPQTGAAFSVEDVTIVGATAYVSCGSDGVYILDVSNPQAPVQTGFIASRGGSSHVAVRGSLLFIADGLNGGLQIVDVSNPAQPIRLSSFKSNTFINDVKVTDTRAYLAGGSAGVIVLDISNPSQPQLLGYQPGWEEAMRVETYSDYAYTAEGIGGLGIFDVHDPAAPQEVGRIEDYSYSVNDVHIVGTWAYLAAGYDGLEIRDVTNPTNAVYASSENSMFGWSLAVASNYVYMAGSSKGLAVYDASDPESVQHVGDYKTSGPAYGVAVCGGYVYVAGGTNGVLVLKATPDGLPPARFSVSMQWDQVARQLRMQAPTAIPMILESTTDLKSWNPVQTNAPVNGAVDFRYTPAAGDKAVFFRARSGP